VTYSDLLRLVPGFDSTMSFERIAPQASYHGLYGSVSNRMQVLVDGRSVYSPSLSVALVPGCKPLPCLISSVSKSCGSRTLQPMAHAHSWA